jgi:hypothetical protein
MRGNKTKEPAISQVSITTLCVRLPLPCSAYLPAYLAACLVLPAFPACHESGYRHRQNATIPLVDRLRPEVCLVGYGQVARTQPRGPVTNDTHTHIYEQGFAVEVAGFACGG